MNRCERGVIGITLVELMIVVVIIGILAALSLVGYHKYIARARLSEATAMLAEFAAKEQIYFLDNGQYREAHNDTVPAKYPSESENQGEFWPQDPTDSGFDSARTPAPVLKSDGNMPTAWRSLGLRPRWKELFCTYMVNAGAGTQGDAGEALPGTVGPTLWANTPAVPWFYAMAVCNLGGQPGWPNTGAQNYVTVMVLTHDSPAVRTTDENM